VTVADEPAEDEIPEEAVPAELDEALAEAETAAGEATPAAE
jgi:hypothetical protein